MHRIVLAASLALAASPALAERPADILARLRGTPSTNAGALGSDFPQQYVNAYRCASPPVVVFPSPCWRPCAAPLPGTIVRVGIDAGPISIGGVYTTGATGIVTCPAAGLGTTTTTTTTIVTTTTTTVTSGGAGVVLAQPQPQPPVACRVLARP